MSTSYGPFLTYIARNEQQQKLATAAHARLARSARPDTVYLVGSLRHWWTERGGARLSQIVHQGLSALGTGGCIAKEAWPLIQREDVDHPNPRLSS